jgi:hypothetical protein
MSSFVQGNLFPKSRSRDLSVEELRAKAEACREEATVFGIPFFREQHLKIALEYDRLAKRGDDYAAQPNGDDPALRVWYPAV